MPERFSEKVEVQDRAGTTTVVLDANAGNIFIGGAKADGSGGQDGDLHVRDSQGNRTILLNGNDGSLTLGGPKVDGTPGVHGDVAVFSNQGIKSVELQGQNGSIVLGAAKADGTAGIHGDISILNNLGVRTIALQGEHGNLTLGGAKVDGTSGQDGDLVVTDAKGQTIIHLDGQAGEIKIRSWSIGVADYVFHRDYPLRPLDDVSAYVHRHHHLPDVPSAADVARDGLELGAFAMTLLRKVEELTLYLFTQTAEVSSLRARVTELERKTP